jgi:hypothetical protein
VQYVGDSGFWQVISGAKAIERADGHFREKQALTVRENLV